MESGRGRRARPVAGASRAIKGFDPAPIFFFSRRRVVSWESHMASPPLPSAATRATPPRRPAADALFFRRPSQEIHGNRWALVAAELPGKTGQQCAQRWRHKVNPAIKKEKWTPEEDAQVRPSPTRARVLPSRSRSHLGEPPAPAFRRDARSLRDRPRAARASRTPTARDLTSPSLEPTTGERRRGRGSVRVSSDVRHPPTFPFLRD